MNKLSFGIKEFESIVDQYPMLKMAKDIVNKHGKHLTSVEPKYHMFLGLDGKQVLDGLEFNFVNGLTLSVIFGFGAYANTVTNSNKLNPSNQFSYLDNAYTAEIAIINKDGLVHIDDWNDSVLGYQSPDEIIQVIEKYILDTPKLRG